MRGDMVTLNLEPIESYRQKRALSKVEFYKLIGVHFMTGSKLFKEKPVHLKISKKVASAINIDVAELIKSWEQKN